VLGPNGSGKSTLLHTLSGIRAASAGSVLLDDRPIARLHQRARARLIGILLQEETAAFWGPVSEYVMLGRFPHGDARDGGNQHVARALHFAGLDGLAGRSLHTLSGGERQRARIAQLLAQSPQILCLDEPLLHLDLRHQLETMHLFRSLATERRRTVLMILHDGLWAARYCDYALLMQREAASWQADPRKC
jgi:iron complex transport system ATP-binding protein